MKKIFLVALLCISTTILCDTDSVIAQAQESFLNEIVQGNSDLKNWYANAPEDKKAELKEWAAGLVSTSVNLIRKSDDVFMGFLEKFEDITQLTNVKLVTEVEVSLEPADCKTYVSQTEADAEQIDQQACEFTRDVLGQLSPMNHWYETASEGEQKQLDYLLAQLFSCVNNVTASAEEAKMRDLAGAIRILTGLHDLQFTLSVQMSIDQNPAVAL